jgi:hypothetical protein
MALAVGTSMRGGARPYEAGYMALPNFRLPDMWKRSAGGIPIPPMPHSATRSASIHQHYYEGLAAEERNDLVWDPDNEDQWTTFFTERRLHQLAQYKGNDPLPANKNAVGWKLW